jgi:hypothetical protein
MLHFCERRAVNPNVSFRSAQLEMGVSLIPELAARERRARRPFIGGSGAASATHDHRVVAATASARAGRSRVSGNHLQPVWQGAELREVCITRLSVRQRLKLLEREHVAAAEKKTRDLFAQLTI